MAAMTSPMTPTVEQRIRTGLPLSPLMKGIGVGPEAQGAGASGSGIYGVQTEKDKGAAYGGPDEKSEDGFGHKGTSQR